LTRERKKGRVSDELRPRGEEEREREKNERREEKRVLQEGVVGWIGLLFYMAVNQG